MVFIEFYDNGFMSNSLSNSGLAPGTYSLTITDANGCTMLEQVNITEPLPCNLSNTFFPIPPSTSTSCDGLILSNATSNSNLINYSFYY